MGFWSTWIHSLTATTALADNDEFAVLDSGASNAPKKVLFSTIKTILQGVFDGRYSQGVTYASTSEVNTGTETAKAINPDVLAGSNFGTRCYSVRVLDKDTALSVANGLETIHIPSLFNGMNIVGVYFAVDTASTSGAPTCNLYSLNLSGNVLSTASTIDANEYDSFSAATPAVIDTAKDAITTSNRYRVDCTGAGTGTKGLTIFIYAQLP